MTLVNGGAHLDFRTRHGGLTPLHKSAIHSRKESIIVSGKNFLIFFSSYENVYRFFLNLVHHRMSMMKKV
jgi:hypothetical protein